MTTTTNTNQEIPLQTVDADTSLEAPHQTLTVDFSWKKFKSIISAADSTDHKPLYNVSYKTFQPNLIFQSASDATPLGTGTLHPISIDADCTVRGRAIKIQALKRFKTEYTHLSPTFAACDSYIENPAVAMTWTSSSGWKNWDFICLDPQQMPVAKFSANTMSLRNVGRIEFWGPVATAHRAFQEEIIVVGMTLMYTMVLRSTSVLSLLGAMVARPGKKEVGKAHEL
ncbi:hypothetical protein NHQ30_001477 [Ciborinia camelliae]|nr:hypothetical protein NHQ30_001477 [Ciborinia camelliae]